MWLKWFPWRFLIRYAAHKKGFLDPFLLVSRVARFSQPAEVLAPVELLRMATVLHARGLINSQVIQQNLDWIWPYWVFRQFNPRDVSFVPRAFSLTHINLTHRNWTAIGLPDEDLLPIVDPRGLVTPFYDGWSLDFWLVPRQGEPLLPSSFPLVQQKLLLGSGLEVLTRSASRGDYLAVKVGAAADEAGKKTCRIQVRAFCAGEGRLVAALRPFNPEGVSFIHKVAVLEKADGWFVNDAQFVFFNERPAHFQLSRYEKGDVFRYLSEEMEEKKMSCDVGMATAAAGFDLKPGLEKEISVLVPLDLPQGMFRPESFLEKAGYHSGGKGFPSFSDPASLWEKSLNGICRLNIPDPTFQFLYDAALRTLVLHSPSGEVYPGPYTYKRFWFRDAAFIVHALLCAGLFDRAEAVIKRFWSRQDPSGYFCSQEGEWDSNGQVLWVVHRFFELTGRPVPQPWHGPLFRGARWIQRKRILKSSDERIRGLLPAGFSAEHFGPNDFYYWDDFWGVQGLRSAAWILDRFGEIKQAALFARQAEEFLEAIHRSLETVFGKLGSRAIPASPFRRLDTGAIGSVVASYPLGLWEGRDERILETIRYLMQECFMEGAYFHDMSHSGINPYLTLHMAQVLLRAGDGRYLDILKSVAALASPTGQWPEAIHPHTRGGCMGDGQHVWASAEWVLMMRSCFVREEKDRLILCSGVAPEWLWAGNEISFGPAPTAYGDMSFSVREESGRVRVSWQREERGPEPLIEVRLPGYEGISPQPGQKSVILIKRAGNP